MQHPAALGSGSALPGAGTAQPAPYLVECKGADGVGCQLDCVQQGHLDHPIGFRTPARPVLVTLYLRAEEEKGSVLGCWLGIWGEEQGFALQRVKPEMSHCAGGPKHPDFLLPERPNPQQKGSTPWAPFHKIQT